MKTTLILIAFFCLIGCSNASKTTEIEDKTSEPTSSEKLPEMPVLPEPVSLTGKFMYYADAATFENCSDSMRYDVQPQAGDHKADAKYLELERYYLNQDIEDMSPVYIALQGHVVKRTDGEEGLANIIVPTEFSAIRQADTDCK